LAFSTPVVPRLPRVPRTSIRGRFLGTVGLLGVLLATSLVALFVSTQQSRHDARERTASDEILNKGYRVVQAASDNEDSVRDYLLVADSRNLARLRAARLRLDEAAAVLARSATGGDPATHTAAHEVISRGRAYVAEHAEPLIADRARGAIARSRGWSLKADGAEHVDAVRRAFDRLIVTESRRVGALTRDGESVVRMARWTSGAAIAASLGVLLFVGLLLRRDVLHPLRDFDTGARRLGAGDLGVRLSEPKLREFAGSQQAFNAMAGELQARRAELLTINAELERRVGERTADLEAARLELLAFLARATEYRDDDTRQHTERVGRTAALIAQGMGMDGACVAVLRLAAPLHDIGKLAVPDSILLKPGRLTPEERAEMARHTIMGAGMLAGSRSDVLQMAETIALDHHERWDGGGYPRGLKGNGIGVWGRIVAVADVFDALTHERPYKEAWPIERALDLIRSEAGAQFDPDVVAAFLTLDHSSVVVDATHPKEASSPDASTPHAFRRPSGDGDRRHNPRNQIGRLA
jgi:HD-GYP domain-containing protein (c-di-GMP phosphodiesterase class II)/CHASE3 domain sensor protein